MFENPNPQPLKKSTRQHLRYTFTEPELLELGKNLARSSQELSQLEGDKKAVLAQLKAQIDGKSAEVQSLSGKLSAGHEYRYLDCDILYHEPAPFMKSIKRRDTGEIVDTQVMSEDERQTELDFEKAEKQRAEPARLVETNEEGPGSEL